MKFTAPLIFLGLMGTVCSNPVCQSPCKPTHVFQEQYFKHVSDLGSSSLAPWELGEDVMEGREPQTIHYAMCKNCTLRDMVAKPIYLQISVYKRVRQPMPNDTDAWCRCPFKLAVGCTCVTRQ